MQLGLAAFLCLLACADSIFALYTQSNNQYWCSQKKNVFKINIIVVADKKVKKSVKNMMQTKKKNYCSIGIYSIVSDRHSLKLNNW